MFLGGQGDMKRRESEFVWKVSDVGLCKFVDVFSSSTRYLRRRKGPAVPTETCKRSTGRKCLATHSFKLEPTMTHVIKICAPFPA